MPFKHNAGRRHRIPRARYLVTNWPAYYAGGCGGVVISRCGWTRQHLLAGRRPNGAGRPAHLGRPAIELVLTLRLVFHLALCEAEAFARSVLKLLGLELCVPDHSTLSRRGRAFAGRQPRCNANGPPHLALDSTGLELFGQGEWDAAKHGLARRRWLKLHMAVDADTGEIAAHKLTEGNAEDAAQVPDLLRQPKGIIASVIADGAYDGEPVYQAAAARQPDQSPNVVIPPRASGSAEHG